MVLMVLAGGGACGGTTQPEEESLDLVGTWQATVPGQVERSYRISAQGEIEIVDADFADESCQTTRGTWSLAGDELTVAVASVNSVPSGGQLTYVVSGTSGSPTLASGGEADQLVPLARMTSCVDYGWGSWVGTVRATIDGDVQSFPVLAVSLNVLGGSFQLFSLAQGCSGCPVEDLELFVTDRGGSGLQQVTYVVDRSPSALRNFRAFYHPFPGDPVFEGFNTDRLTPDGQLVLEQIASDRILASFRFTANPLADGQSAPDGRTSAQVENGLVDLFYREP